MSKRFCVTGTCIPAKNYMVDISDRVDMIIHDYIDKYQQLREAINNRYEEVKELITNFLRKKPKFGKYTKKI